MPETAPEYSIARDYDPYNEILSADSDPMAAYLTYLADVTGGAVGNMGFTVDDFREYINSLKQRRRVLSPPRCHSARVGTTSLTSDQPLSRSSKNCRILNIEESKIWLSPSSHRSTDERDTPSSRESRVLPQVDRLEKFRKRVKISAFSCSRRSLALVLNFYLVAEAQIRKPVKRMAAIHIVSLSELRIADTAPKL
jgi:hypothetical protein